MGKGCSIPTRASEVSVVGVGAEVGEAVLGAVFGG